MVDQYKLRLGDGTVLAVDEQGLRTWLLDGRAMVQRPGSQAWRPLKEILAALARESAAAPSLRSRGPAPSRTRTRARARAAARTAVRTAARTGGGAACPHHPARVVTAPLAESIARPGAKLDDGIPIIPFKRLDDDEAPLPAAVPSGDLREVAAAALDHAEATRNEGTVAVAGGGRRRPARTWRAASADVPACRVAGQDHRAHQDRPTEGEVLVRQGPVDPRAIVYPPVPGELAVRAAVEWGKDVV